MEEEKKLELLFKAGITALENDEYRLARKKFKEILTIAPDNTVAKQKMEEIEEKFTNQVSADKKKEKRTLFYFAIALAVFMALYFFVILII